VEVRRRKGAEMEGKTAVPGKLGEQSFDRVEAQNQSRRREEMFAEKEVAEQKR